ncbi:universal stress protein [Micrococcus sp.]|uniref:universal stress protein n=1 Tax=Micrococcus sp. TaxID=1271 RepID=UPI002A91ACBF|nr:universal stress protein [Micrococcus sp.]MDY6056016.1 universal stress protein [Micrococcus sp.]
MSHHHTIEAGQVEEAPLGVVVGVDGSEQSVAAAVWAQREAGCRQEPLTLVTAYTAPAVWGYGMEGVSPVLDDERISGGLQALLEEVAGRLDQDGVKPALRVETGDPVRVLLDLSAHATLLVVGARSREGFIGRLLGSVASALPGHARCPVAIVPSGGETTRAHRGGPVVVGVDGSEQARAAALAAAEEAHLRGAPLRMITALPPLGANAVWLGLTVDEEARAQEIAARLDAGARWLQDVVPGLEVSTEVLNGSPVEVMASETRAARLAVIGTRGMGGVAGALMGSTSRSVAEHLHGPLLVVPYREDERLARRRDFGPVAEQEPPRGVSMA